MTGLEVLGLSRCDRQAVAMLDLKLETVSREISALVRDGLIRPLDQSGRRCEILDDRRLRVL